MRKPKLGPTGQFPNGQLNKDDEGGINIAVGRRGNVIILEFGKPIAWLGMSPEDAKRIGESLLTSAKLVAGEENKEGL